MTRFAPQPTLVRVTKAKKHEIDRWKEGRRLESTTGRTLEELSERVVADRYSLAVQVFASAERLMRKQESMYRFAVGRYYYAMYHAMRAAAFWFHGGDDHEEHKLLPGKTPDDMPNNTLLGNALKSARERRNAADYDPYPKADSAWRKDADDLRTAAGNMLSEVRLYLKAKGCRYI